MIRVCDVILSLIGLIITSPIAIAVLMLCYLETRHPIFAQIRVGRGGKPFWMYKFRTMVLSTQDAPTHSIDSSQVTRVGKLLRKCKLDELPQLINVLSGDMSLVGPRPCLPIQLDVIKARQRLDVNRYRPGITGLAQIFDVDMSKPAELAALDAEMLTSLRLPQYLTILALTLCGRGFGDRVGSFASTARDEQNREQQHFLG